MVTSFLLFYLISSITFLLFFLVSNLLPLSLFFTWFIPFSFRSFSFKAVFTSVRKSGRRHGHGGAEKGTGNREALRTAAFLSSLNGSQIPFNVQSAKTWTWVTQGASESQVSSQDNAKVTRTNSTFRLPEWRYFLSSLMKGNIMEKSPVSAMYVCRQWAKFQVRAGHSYTEQREASKRFLSGKEH